MVPTVELKLIYLRMKHIKGFIKHEEDEKLEEGFHEILQKIMPGLKRDGNDEAIDNLEQLNTPENLAKVKKSIFTRTCEFAKNTWASVKREGKETKQAMEILQRMLKGEEVSDNEKKFLKSQSGDLIKGLAAVVISGIPVPFPITPLLVIVGKKYNFNVLPQDQQYLLEQKEKESDTDETPENI